MKNAVESALPFYEPTSEIISLGLAAPLRRKAIGRLRGSSGDWMLDSGAGPGVSSRIMIEYGFEEIVGLDPSHTLLRYAKKQLGPKFNPIVGVAENLPIHDNRITGTIACFSLRDVRDLGKSITEFARVTQVHGQLEIVDIGKPDGPVLRRLISLYITIVMPMFARVWIGRRSRRNPFKMIIPTFRRLPKNKRLKSFVEQGFGASQLEEVMFGGLIILDAERRSSIARF